MQEQQRKSSSVQTSENRPFVTRAVGLEETTGRLRARRSSLFTQTIILVTGLVCFAFLLGSLAQAWSNSMLAASGTGSPTTDATIASVP